MPFSAPIIQSSLAAGLFTAANPSPYWLILVLGLILVGLVVVVVTVLVLTGRRRRVPPILPPVAVPPGMRPPAPPGYPSPADMDATMMQPGQATTWQLTVTAGADAGRVFPLGARAQLGRAPNNEVHLSDSMLSRAHALIEWRGSGYTLSDLGSSNGTVLNEVLLAQPAALKVGDVIRVGSTRLTVAAGPARAPIGVPVPPGAPYAPATAAPPLSSERGGCLTFKVLLYLVGWLVFFAIVATAVYLYTREPLAPAGVGLAALISLIFMVSSLSGSWQGRLMELRTERVYVADDDGGDWEDQVFAYIQEPNRRKVRKMRAMPGWEAGDWLEKRRGETHIRVRRG
jgi:hypothetical protein